MELQALIVPARTLLLDSDNYLININKKLSENGAKMPVGSARKNRELSAGRATLVREFLGFITRSSASTSCCFHRVSCRPCR